MESIINYGPTWLAYLSLAVVGLWCWQQLFFWLPATGDGRSFSTVLGAVILFTPAPIASDSSHFAPAVFVIILDALSGLSPLKSPALIWLLAAACVSVFIMTLRKLIKRVGLKSE